MALPMHGHAAAAAVQDIDEAIHRLPQDVVDARMQRLKRAVDCSLKKSYLSKEIQDMQTPYSWYLKVMHSVPPHPPHPAFQLVHPHSQHAMQLGLQSCAENETEVTAAKQVQATICPLLTLSSSGL